MTSRHLTVIPRLFVGIDVGKSRHVAAFVSAEILACQRFEHCPTLSFEQTRAGFVALLTHIREYVQHVDECAVLIEATGHYHRSLVEWLMAEGIQVYVVAVRQKRVVGTNKTDRYDARRLANQLYAQLALGLQIEEKSQQVRQVIAPTPAAMQLHGLVQCRYELIQQQTRMKNKLTAICDEIFPEFTSVLRDPNGLIALDLRAHFPTPAAVARASLDELCTVKHKHFPSREKLKKLQEVARASVGITSPPRLRALELEQAQLIEALSLIRQQLDHLETKITDIVTSCREGQILLSMPLMGPIHAATLIAFIGNIRNFQKRSELRRFCGWSPQSHQTGTSADRDTMTPTGGRLLRQTLFLLAFAAISQNQVNVWTQLYTRLLPKKCAYDARTGTWKGKKRVIGRIAGQMVSVIYTLLKQDADLLDHAPDPSHLPDPQLYDPEIHAGTKPRVPSQSSLTNSTGSGKIA